MTSKKELIDLDLSSAPMSSPVKVVRNLLDRESLLRTETMRTAPREAIQSRVRALTSDDVNR
jgi:hypothetical protein